MPSLDQILRIRQLPIVQVHVPLSRRDVGVPQQPARVLDPFLPTNLRAALVPRQRQHQIPPAHLAAPGNTTDAGEPSRRDERAKMNRDEVEWLAASVAGLSGWPRPDCLSGWLPSDSALRPCQGTDS